MKTFLRILAFFLITTYIVWIIIKQPDALIFSLSIYFIIFLGVLYFFVRIILPITGFFLAMRYLAHLNNPPMQRTRKNWFKKVVLWAISILFSLLLFYDVLDSSFNNILFFIFVFGWAIVLERLLESKIAGKIGRTFIYLLTIASCYVLCGLVFGKDRVKKCLKRYN